MPLKCFWRPRVNNVNSTFEKVSFRHLSNSRCLPVIYMLSKSGDDTSFKIEHFTL